MEARYVNLGAAFVGGASAPLETLWKTGAKLEDLLRRAVSTGSVRPGAYGILMIGDQDSVAATLRRYPTAQFVATAPGHALKLESFTEPASHLGATIKQELDYQAHERTGVASAAIQTALLPLSVPVTAARRGVGTTARSLAAFPGYYKRVAEEVGTSVKRIATAAKEAAAHRGWVYVRLSEDAGVALSRRMRTANDILSDLSW